METMLEEVAATLAQIRHRGDFATRVSCSAEDLQLSVKGVGPVRLPVTASRARALGKIGRRAPFGRGEETLHDEAVRNTWEVAKSRVKIDQRRWKRALEPLLEKIADDLGITPQGKVEVVLHKLLVYEPGQFFVTHQDSETSDDMMGTLVVVLPSRYKGGALVIRHNGDEKVFGRTQSAGKRLSLIAFYSDCHHEVRPITSGYRVVLTYHLLRRGAPDARPSLSDPPLVDHLAERVDRYFSTPVPRSRFSREEPRPPDRLVFLLDHQYTQRSLGWNRLKGSDPVRVGALLDVADRLDCERYLVLADVHEVWGCEEPDGSYRGRGRDGWPDNGWTSEDADEHCELADLQDSDVELRHWVGPDGKADPAVPSAAYDHEICFTRASVDMEPFQSEYEGFMGNYGNTMDRWYHRAAMVIWPRDRTFVIRAKLSPSWALGEIGSLLKRRRDDEARDRTRSLLPFWKRHGPEDKGAAFFARLVRVAGALADAELAADLLAPFGPHRLSRSSVPPFVALVERYGAPWSQRVFEGWVERRAYGVPSWLPQLPDLCSALKTCGDRATSEFARWVLKYEVKTFEERCLTRLGARMVRWKEDGLEGLVDDVEPLLRACVALDESASRDRLVAFLTAPETGVPLMVLAALLRKIRDPEWPATAKAPVVDVLYRHLDDGARSIVNRPERDRTDWSIEFPLRCSCDLCAELEAFLSDPGRVTYDWPLAQNRRRHIHDTIDGHDLPVSHETLRSGRPYTLRLRKQELLFAREKAWRDRHVKLLAWLRSNRRALGCK